MIGAEVKGGEKECKREEGRERGRRISCVRWKEEQREGRSECKREGERECKGEGEIKGGKE